MEEAGREGGGDGKGCGECLHLAQIVHDDVGEEFETPTTARGARAEESNRALLTHSQC